MDSKRGEGRYNCSVSPCAAEEIRGTIASSHVPPCGDGGELHVRWTQRRVVKSTLQGIIWESRGSRKPSSRIIW